MKLEDAIEFLNNMANNYEEDSEVWYMEALDEPGDYERSMHYSNSCGKKADAIRTVLNALSTLSD